MGGGAGQTEGAGGGGGDPVGKLGREGGRGGDPLGEASVAEFRFRDKFAMAMGPMTLGFEEFVGMRLNEHAFHTWDVEVVTDPAATIPTPLAEFVVDNLDLGLEPCPRPRETAAD
jgi:hypothetical protein